MYTVILDIFGGEFSNARYIIIFVHLLQSFITILELPSAEIEKSAINLKGGFLVICCITFVCQVTPMTHSV